MESQDVSPANRKLSDYMVGIVNERTPAPSIWTDAVKLALINSQG